MSPTEIAERVNAAIAEEFELDPARITPEQTLIEGLGLDSLDSVDLIAAMERTFKVKCPEAEARQLRTVGDIYTLVGKIANK